MVHHGDALDVLCGMAENSVDMLATDPPYGWSFMGKGWDRVLPDPAIWRECLRVLKPGAAACVMSGARLDCLWRVCRDLEEAGFELAQSCFTWVYRSGFPKGDDLSKRADKRAGAEREVVGKNPHSCTGRKPGIMHINGANTRPAMEARMVADGYDKPPITAPATPLAVSLDGQFTKGKIKPAMEFIIWARKPISEKTELDNVVRWGTGSVNCGKCMVPGDDKKPSAQLNARTNAGIDPDYVRGGWRGIDVDEPFVTGANAGRFPANVLCTDAALGEASKYFDIESWAAEHGIAEDGWADAAAAGMLQVPKPSRAEKNQGCEGLPERLPMCNAIDQSTFQHTNTKAETRMTNYHPSVKPIRLFSYLIHLLCPSGGLVLDPFCGSGTTGVAAVQAGYQFVGCDMEAEYCEIARARIEHATAAPRQLAMEGT